MSKVATSAPPGLTHPSPTPPPSDTTMSGHSSGDSSGSSRSGGSEAPRAPSSPDLQLEPCARDETGNTTGTVRAASAPVGITTGYTTAVEKGGPTGHASATVGAASTPTGHTTGGKAGTLGVASVPGGDVTGNATDDLTGTKTANLRTTTSPAPGRETLSAACTASGWLGVS